MEEEPKNAVEQENEPEHARGLMSITGLIGRESEVKMILQKVKAAQDTLLLGDEGVGKRAILFQACDLIKKRHVIRIHEYKIKAQMVELFRALFYLKMIPPENAFGADAKGVDIEDIYWQQIEKKVERYSVKNLGNFILPALQENGSKLIIAIDDVTNIMPGQVGNWATIMNYTVVFACAHQKKASISSSKFWDRFEHIRINSLENKHIQDMCEKYIAKKGMFKVNDPALLTKRVVQEAKGNPQSAYEMLNKAFGITTHRNMTQRDIRSLRNMAGKRKFDFTPFILILFAFVPGMRYFAMGTGERELYIAAGLSAGFLMVLRMYMMKFSGRID